MRKQEVSGSCPVCGRAHLSVGIRVSCAFSDSSTALHQLSISSLPSPPFPPPFVADREVQRILLELLNQMDGFDQSVNVKVSNSGRAG